MCAGNKSLKLTPSLPCPPCAGRSVAVDVVSAQPNADLGSEHAASLLRMALPAGQAPGCLHLEVARGALLSGPKVRAYPYTYPIYHVTYEPSTEVEAVLALLALNVFVIQYRLCGQAASSFTPIIPVFQEHRDKTSFPESEAVRRCSAARPTDPHPMHMVPGMCMCTRTANCDLIPLCCCHAARSGGGQRGGRGGSQSASGWQDCFRFAAPSHLIVQHSLNTP